MEAGLSYGYLSTIWPVLREDPPSGSPVADLGVQWKVLAEIQDAGAARKQSERMDASVRLLRSKFPAGEPKLEVKNEELSIVLLEQEAERNPEFKVAGFIEVKKVLRLDVLAGEEDAFLKKFRIHRTQEDTFSAKPATLKLGEAVKEEEPGTK